MGRFTNSHSADLPIDVVGSVAVLTIFLQMTIVASGSLPPGLHPDYHHHHPHHPHHPGFEYPVRWPKSPHGHQHRRRPVHTMTDVINNLGVKILNRYVENDGNVAFSPSGLGFVLVALFEGSAGSSAREISEVLGLPQDRRITRIGLRDVHRRLRSYLNADAFLGGLTLNREDINLRPEYEDVLRFYGFDISDSGNETANLNTTTNITDAVSTTLNPTTINDAVEFITNVPTTQSSQTDGTTSTTNVPTSIDTMAQTVTPINAVATDATTIDAMNGQIVSSSATLIPGSTMQNTPAATTVTSMMMSIVQAIMNSMNTSTAVPPVQIGVPTAPSSGVQNQSSTGSTVALGTSTGDSIVATSSMMNTLINDSAMQNSIAESTGGTSNNIGSTTPMTSAINLGTSMNPGVATNLMINSTTLTTNPVMALTTLPIMTIVPSTIVPTLTVTESSANSESVNGTTMISSSTTIQMANVMTTTAGDTMTNTVRKRRSVLRGPSGYFSSSADDSIWLDVFGRLSSHDDYQSQDEDIVENSPPSTQLDFLVNGCDYSRVTAATYTAVLPFAHFPSLRTALLEFPLDDPRYKIIVMLPSESNGTRRLAKILATKPITLRLLRRALQPTWVNAIIPSFMLRGYVTLTPYLQKLGISDVFEPRTADLSLMSPDLGTYARDIQQSIGVNIRNNIDGGIGGAGSGNEDQQQQQPANLARGTRGVLGLPHPFFVAGGAISPRSLGHIPFPPYPAGAAGPIPFIVDRPFLYFIVDDETSVSLLAGRIDDPLNSRITQ